jgi:hypothetical protein
MIGSLVSSERKLLHYAVDCESRRRPKNRVVKAE